MAASWGEMGFGTTTHFRLGEAAIHLITGPFRNRNEFGRKRHSQSWKHPLCHGSPAMTRAESSSTHSIVTDLLGQKAGEPGIAFRAKISLVALCSAWTIAEFEKAHASHSMSVRQDSETSGRIRTRFDEPHIADSARYNVEIRYFDSKSPGCRFTLLVDGVARGAEW